MANRPEEVAMNSDSDKREYTIILAGKLGVGKSSIFRRIQTGVFTEYPSVSTEKRSVNSRWHELLGKHVYIIKTVVLTS